MQPWQSIVVNPPITGTKNLVFFSQPGNDKPKLLKEKLIAVLRRILNSIVCWRYDHSKRFPNWITMMKALSRIRHLDEKVGAGPMVQTWKQNRQVFPIELYAQLPANPWEALTEEKWAV